MNADYPSHERAPDSHLSARELEVLKQVALGKANKAIALELQISRRTVERHVYLIMRKLDIHARVNLLRYALTKGLVPLPPPQ
jgi:DNA-binding NarL/FixJ family response regulator